ncbi:MAG: ABC transporter ATP-binding protein [Synechococcaceae cyanobacterium SM2_3_2]|nr:ABC transporter ATP-binding protein [Synechococcaceae cyanobacterium SM2_3_2]
MKKLSIWGSLRRLIAYVPRLYAFDALFWGLISILPALPGLILKLFFDGLTGATATGWNTSTLITFLLATGMMRIGVIFAGRVTKTQHRFTISGLVRRNLLAGILQRPGALAMQGAGGSLSSGAVISFFREDAEQVEDNVAWTNELLGDGLFALSALGILLFIDIPVTVGAVLPLVLVVLVVERANKALKRYRQASRLATQKVTGLVGEMFGAVQAIKVAGAEAHLLGHFEQLSEQRRRAALRDRLLSSLLNSVFENLNNIGTGIILLLVATGSENFSVGDFALFIYYLAYVSGFVLSLGEFLALSKHTEVSLDRMEKLLPESGSVLTLLDPQPLYLPDLRDTYPPLPPLDPLPARISLQRLRAEHLTYVYPGSLNGIRDISFALERGSLTVVTGDVGSGKTTVLKTLLGLLPQESGSLLWNEFEIGDPAQFFVPPQAAYTPQVPRLLSQTLQENLKLGLPLSDQDLEWVIEQAALQSDLAQMPLGLETQIGSKGVRLSGGQIQRTAAARMLIRKPELMVFDDLSSALDVETERRLWEQLLSLRENSQGWIPTFLVVSHRPFVLNQADQVLRLCQGSLG